MVLKLRELLIKQVAIHLAYLPSEICQRLTADQRERVIRWLASHDCLSSKLLPYITRNLLSVPLHSLEFYKCNQLTNDMLIEFAQSNHFSRLKSLIIHQCNQVQGKFTDPFLSFQSIDCLDSGICAITKGQLSLEYIALRKLSNLTNAGLVGIHSAFLKEIDFRRNDKIQDHGILTIVSNNLNLRVIRIVDCFSITRQSVIHIAQNLAAKLVCVFFHGFKYREISSRKYWISKELNV